MLNTGTGFARYSKNLSWFVAIIWLVLSVLTFTGGGENSVLNGFLWMAGAVAFAISAMFIGKSAATTATANDDPTGG
ncbi:MAG: hypothetical protein EXR84_04325 [Gammaproteobacteria bacterium]|nr:hypothetical protein [Gammaproteobacteria bacterium]